jgi:hypothetical protein
MIRSGSRRYSSAAALPLRRLSTSNDQARPRAVLDSRLVVRSPLRDAGSAHRNRPNETRHPIDCFPKSRSTHLGNKPPASKSP